MDEINNNIEEFGWNNPVLSRKEVHTLFHQVFKDKKLDGVFSISASSQVHEFDTKLRELTKNRVSEKAINQRFIELENKINKAKAYWEKFNEDKQCGIVYGLGLVLSFMKELNKIQHE